MHKPQPGEYNPYYDRYIALVKSDHIVKTLQEQNRETMAMLSQIPESRGGHRYAPGKWSIKDVIGHMADTERIMAYRALRIARGDATPLAGFEQDDYVRGAAFERRSLAGLADEFRAVRGATVALFENLDPADWERQGVANQNAISVRAQAWIIAGHELHHRGILKDRYLAG